MLLRKKTAELCGKCAALYGMEYDVTRIAGGRNHKVLCEHCNRSRYGGTYEIGKKKR